MVVTYTRLNICTLTYVYIYIYIYIYIYTYTHTHKHVCHVCVCVCMCGPGSSAGIATDYGFDGPGSNPGGDEIFRLSRTALGPT